MFFLEAYIDGSCAALLTMIITNKIFHFFTGYVLVIINRDFGGKHRSIPNGEKDMRKYSNVKISRKCFENYYYIFSSEIL